MDRSAPLDPDTVLLAHIGLVAAQWSHIEVLFSLSIWYLLDLDFATGKIVTGGLDMHPRANMAIRLCRHLKGPKPLLDALVATRKLIQDGLDQRRNQAIHGVHFPTGIKGISDIEVHRGKGSGKRERLSITELSKLCDDLTTTRKQLDLVIEGLILKRAAERIASLQKPDEQNPKPSPRPARTRKGRKPPPQS